MNARQTEFERTAIPHLASLLRFASRLAPDSAAAHDLVQETYLRAWRAFDQLKTDSNVRAWLFRILINTSYSANRKAMPTVPLADLAEFSEPSRGNSIEESLEVLEALDALTNDHKQVIILTVMEGFTCREASEILGVPQGTVMSRLSRAREALREALTPRLQKV